MSPIRGLLTKAVKGARPGGLGRWSHPWLLPAAAIIVVALADITFGNTGAFLALGAIAFVVLGFGAGLASAGSPRQPTVDPPGPAANTQAVADAAAKGSAGRSDAAGGLANTAGGATRSDAAPDDGADAAGSADAYASAGTGTQVSGGAPAAVSGEADDVTAGTRTDLSFARLTDAKLTGADLRDADLRYAVLRGADLRGANLNRVNLEGADLTGARLAPLMDKDTLSH